MYTNVSTTVHVRTILIIIIQKNLVHVSRSILWETVGKWDLQKGILQRLLSFRKWLLHIFHGSKIYNKFMNVCVYIYFQPMTPQRASY